MIKEQFSIPIDEIRKAKEVLSGKIFDSPILPVYDAYTPGGSPIYIKAENLQPSGSFKIRGAVFAISKLTDSQKRSGVIAYSTGNHAQAVALAALRLGVHSTVVMSPDAPEFKVEATRKYGANVIMSEPTSQARRQRAEELAKSNNYALIPPYDNIDVITGQGTIALEILDQIDASVIFVPIGGGGLLAGIVSAIKQLKPEILVIGVEPELENDAYQSFRSDHKISLPKASGSIADAIKVQCLGDVTYPLIKKYVDDIVVVKEKDIAEAMLMLLNKNHILVEPSGSLGLAAALKFESEQISGKKPVICIASGGNITVEKVEEIRKKFQLSTTTTTTRLIREAS